MLINRGVGWFPASPARYLNRYTHTHTETHIHTLFVHTFSYWYITFVDYLWAMRKITNKKQNKTNQKNRTTRILDFFFCWIIKKNLFNTQNRNESESDKKRQKMKRKQTNRTHKHKDTSWTQIGKRSQRNDTARWRKEGPLLLPAPLPIEREMNSPFVVGITYNVRIESKIERGGSPFFTFLFDSSSQATRSDSVQTAVECFEGS